MTKTIINLTDNAIARIKTLMSASEKPILGVRVGVATKGCSGKKYTFSYAEERRAGDEEITIDGATIFIEPSAVLFIIGSTLDFIEEKLSSRFVFTNPNEKGSCGCGESFYT